jgi:hypothetical protein
MASFPLMRMLWVHSAGCSAHLRHVAAAGGGQQRQRLQELLEGDGAPLQGGWACQADKWSASWKCSPRATLHHPCTAAEAAAAAPQIREGGGCRQSGNPDGSPGAVAGGLPCLRPFQR